MLQIVTENERRSINLFSQRLITGNNYQYTFGDCIPETVSAANKLNQSTSLLSRRKGAIL
jgi:hypothetical protein